METLKNDLLKIVQGSLELNGKSGPLQAPSWRFPEKLAGSVDIDEALKALPLVADSHVFLLELIIDRLLFLMQNMAKILESNSSTQRTSTPALTLGSAVKKVVKCALKSSTKIKTLEEELTATQRKFKALESQLETFATQPTKQESLELDEEPKNRVPPTTTDHPPLNPLSSAVTTVSCSTQTTETSFVLCTRCFGTQRALIESVNVVSNECGKLKLRSVLGSTDWLAMVELGDLDLTKWTTAFWCDMESLGKYRSRLQEAMVALTTERDSLKDMVDSMDRENGQLRDEMVSLQASITNARSKNDAALAKRNKEFTEAIANLTEVHTDLETSNLELRTKFAASREEVGSLSSALSSLKAHCKKVESDLHQAECHEEELEKKRKGMEEQISLLSEKMKMIHDVLDHQQVELKKSKVYNELLENKHKTLKRKQAALLSQLDELDQECSSLREEVTEVRVHRQKLEEELQGLQESHQQLQLQFREKENKLSESINMQRDLSIQLTSLRTKLADAEQQLEFEKSNCRLLMDFPYICKTGENYSDHIASLVCKRLSQKQINSNTVRIYLLEEQNNDLRYLNLKEAIKEKTEDVFSRQRNVTDFKKPIRLWQKNLTDDLEKNWHEADVMKRPVNPRSESSDRRSNSSSSKSATCGIKNPRVEPKMWADKRPNSTDQSRLPLKGNIGHLMKAIDLHRVKSPDSGGLNPPTTSPSSTSTGSRKPGLIDTEDPRNIFTVCENCDKICYEEPYGYCPNCDAQCQGAK